MKDFRAVLWSPETGVITLTFGASGGWKLECDGAPSDAPTLEGEVDVNKFGDITVKVAVGNLTTVLSVPQQRESVPDPPPPTLGVVKLVTTAWSVGDIPYMNGERLS